MKKQDTYTTCQLGRLLAVATKRNDPATPFGRSLVTADFRMTDRAGAAPGQGWAALALDDFTTLWCRRDGAAFTAWLADEAARTAKAERRRLRRLAA
jgi:hypothetical protein